LSANIIGVLWQQPSLLTNGNKKNESHTIAVTLNYFDRCVLAQNSGAFADLYILGMSCLFGFEIF
jgi:hypothetical protein